MRPMFKTCLCNSINTTFSHVLNPINYNKCSIFTGDESDKSFNNWLGNVVDRVHTSGSSDTEDIRRDSRYGYAQSGVGNTGYRTDYQDSRYSQQEVQPQQYVPPEQQVLPQEGYSQEQIENQPPLPQQWPQKQYTDYKLPQQHQQQQFPEHDAQYPQESLKDAQRPLQQYSQQWDPEGQRIQEQYPQQQLLQQASQQQWSDQQLSGVEQPQKETVQEQYLDEQHPTLVAHQSSEYNWGDGSDAKQKVYESEEEQTLQNLPPLKQAPIYQEEELYKPVLETDWDDNDRLVQNTVDDDDDDWDRDGARLEESSSYAQQQGHPGQHVAQQQSYPKQQPQQVRYSDQMLLPGQQQGYPEQQPQLENIALDQVLSSEDYLRDQLPAQTRFGEQQYPQQQGTPDLRLSQQQQLFPQIQVPADQVYTGKDMGLTGQQVTTGNPTRENTEDPNNIVPSETTDEDRPMSDQELLSSLMKRPEQQDIPPAQQQLQMDLAPDKSALLIHGAPEGLPQQPEATYQLPPYSQQDSQVKPDTVLPSVWPSQPASPYAQPQFSDQDVPHQPYLSGQADQQQLDGMEDTQKIDEQLPVDPSRTNSLLSKYIYPPQENPQADLHPQETNKTEESEKSDLITSSYGKYQSDNGQYIPEISQTETQGEKVTDVGEHNPPITVNINHPEGQESPVPTVQSSVDLSTTQKELGFRYPDSSQVLPDGARPLGTGSLSGTVQPSMETTEGDERLTGGKEPSGGAIDQDMKQWLKG